MATGNFTDPYLLEDSDQECARDSDEDEQAMHTDAKKSKRSRINLKHIRQIVKPTAVDSSSEDEFEREMSIELDKKISTSVPDWTKEHYNTEDRNDALFYDPKLDDDDQRWVDQQRRSYRSPVDGSTSAGSRQKTDAVLNCPACLCTVCLDCQRHDIYHSQYRAMFTMNTVVDYGEILQFKAKHSKRNKRKRKNDSEASGTEALRGFDQLESVDKTQFDPMNGNVDCYHPVNCSNCNTRIAVYDSDEVYHFFNILSSYS